MADQEDDEVEAVEVDRFRWEQALRDDPAFTGTRLLVLLTLATYMDADGSGAFPAQETLAAATGLKERAVRTHLTAALGAAWLIRLRRGHRLGNGSSTSSLYRAAIPQPACPDRLRSTAITEPVESLDRHRDDAQPASPRASTGTGVPATTSHHEETMRESALDIARHLVVKQPDEVGARLRPLIDRHGEQLVVEALAAAELDGPYEYVSRLLPVLDTHLARLVARRRADKPRCDRPDCANGWVLDDAGVAWPCSACNPEARAS